MDDPEFISKSQRKRDSHARQDIGEELMALSVDELKHFELPEDLLTAILEAKRIPVSKHTAMKRQRQYVGRLMRSIDPEPILEQLSALKGTSAKQNALMHLTEDWREKLLSNADGLEAFVREYPDAPVEQLGKLALLAKEERAQSKPPKRFRELYKAIHELVMAKAKA